MQITSMRQADVIAGIVFAVSAMALFVHTFSDRYDTGMLLGDVSTVYFPRIVLCLIIALSLGLAVKGMRSDSEVKLLPVNIRRVVLTFGAAVLTTAGCWFAGYLIAMPVGIFLIGLAMGYPNRLVLAATSVVAPLLVWLVLSRFAQVPFPSGVLF